MQVIYNVAIVILLLAVILTVLVWLDLKKHPQPMKIMDIVWPLTILWSSFLGFFAYMAFGRMKSKKPMKMNMSDNGGDMKGMAMDMSDKKGAKPGMSMDMSNKHSDMTNMKMDMSDKPADMSNMKMSMADKHHDMANMKMDMSDKNTAMPDMKMNMSDKQTDMAGMKMDMPGMKMDMPERPFWQKIALSSFHCGAGCTLADIIGESVGTQFLLAVNASGIVYQWTLDFILALLIGALFQFFAIRPMMRSASVFHVFGRALRVDFLSLTSWQVGMYLCSYLILNVMFHGTVTHSSPIFWFAMQLAMLAGFVCAYPMNWFLVSRGIKPAM